jgi:alpha-beta hydrolase superfamily lysophospholipase
VPGSSFKAYPGLRHEIFNEPEQEQVFADVLEFVERVALREERAPTRPAAAASA